MKTTEEINKLKSDWRLDPCWDIEETDGFGSHKDELLAYRLEQEKLWRDKEDERKTYKASTLNCSVAMVDYLERLERRIVNLEQR